ncbi:MAG: PAS domain-containing protein [Tatlockia sp.]|nr:PAS domain-containing protein [Tatlockia sp.]
MKPTNGEFWHRIKTKISLEAVLNSFPYGIYIKGLSGHFLYCNTQLSLNAELSLSTKKHLTDYDMPWKPQADLIINQEKNLLRLNNPVEESVGNFCLRRTLLHDENQSPIAILGIYYPQSTRQESVFNLEEIIADLPGHVFWKNTDCILQGCNNEQARDVGLASREEIVGKTAYDLIWQDQSEEIKREQAALTDAIDIRIMKSNTPQAMEEYVVLPDGSNQYFWSTKKPLHDDSGKVNGLLGISVDITERKNMEKDLHLAKDKAEAANYIMTEFIANMGHDLATPITDVSSIAQILADYSDEYPELQELFDTLAARANACEIVQKSIINATSISKLTIKPDMFSLVNELLILETQLRPTIGSKNVKLIIHPLKPKKEDLIETDRTKLHEILYDLLSNAINFTEEGQVTLSVVKEGRFFHIKIADTGIGIPPDKFEFIFGQYTKLSRSNKFGATFKGVGAGLYLAKLRATILNATITVESELNKGSTFTLSIPTRPIKTS